MTGLAVLIILGEMFAGTMLFVAFAYVVKAMAEHEDAIEKEKTPTVAVEAKLQESKA